MATRATFSIGRVNALRNEAARAREIEIDDPRLNGWIASPVDPAELLSVFTSLRLKKGWGLIAYLFREGGNGNGVIWAVPSGETIPELEHAGTNPFEPVRGVWLEAPKPVGAVPVMEAVTGDASLWSYLSASLFSREAEEFGAAWHGCDWTDYTILGSDPWESSGRGASEAVRDLGDLALWNWKQPKPDNWEPEVVQREDRVRVQFLTFSPVGQYSIYCHRDVYKAGSYSPESHRQTIAQGPGGLIF